MTNEIATFLNSLERNPQPLQFEIFYEDLTSEAQKQLKETFSAEAEQFNDMPIAVAYWPANDKE